MSQYVPLRDIKILDYAIEHYAAIVSDMVVVKESMIKPVMPWQKPPTPEYRDAFYERIKKQYPPKKENRYQPLDSKQKQAGEEDMSIDEILTEFNADVINEKPTKEEK